MHQKQTCNLKGHTLWTGQRPSKVLVGKALPTGQSLEENTPWCVVTLHEAPRCCLASRSHVGDPCTLPPAEILNVFISFQNFSPSSFSLDVIASDFSEKVEAIGREWLHAPRTESVPFALSSFLLPGINCTCSLQRPALTWALGPMSSCHSRTSC